MKRRKLPFHAQQHPAKQGLDVLDSIMIFPRSSGVLNGGQYSKNNLPPKHRLKIVATNESSVDYEEINRGTEERYVLIYEINNYNDSPCFAYIEVIKEK
jgi:hypothetical protein